MHTQKGMAVSFSSNGFFNILSVILLTNFIPAIADVSASSFYYSDGNQISLTLSTESIAVRFKQGVTLNQQGTIVGEQGGISSFDDRQELPVLDITLLPLSQPATEELVIQTINNLNAEEEVEFASPVFIFPDAELTLTDEFIVKFKSTVSQEDINIFNLLNGVEIARKPQWADWYVLRVIEPNVTNALQMANLYYESQLAEFSVPNFVRRLEPMSVTPNDTYFQNQWVLHNTGQTGGTPDADIGALEGWEINTGSSDIVIAIIDEGVDIIHADLVDKLVGGYDFVENDNDPTPWNNDAHGTTCAGLAAAQTNNAMGIAGVAQLCKIMPIRIACGDGHGGWITYDEWVAGGIQWAADNGADVLSNSWGGGPSSPVIHNAIINAKNNGRNGKGCVIVFASGNLGSSVSYPARYPEAIAVGATNEGDIRWDYSNYGPELDVVAPSGLINLQGNLWTTDITGSAGYNNRNPNILDYTDKMGGTSGAAPLVAGLAALILSAKPNLTSNEVQSVIESTADDKGAPGWDQYYGWGRINVYNALSRLLKLDIAKVDDVNNDDCVIVGDEITYTISYGNPVTDPCDKWYIGTVTDVNIMDNLPDELGFISASNGGSYDSNSRTVTWNIGTLEPNDSGSVTLMVKVLNKCFSECGVITNFCEIKGSKWSSGRAFERTPICCAGNPKPAAGGVGVLDVNKPRDINLVWCRGRFAADVNGHEVYFGTDYKAVSYTFGASDLTGDNAINLDDLDILCQKWLTASPEADIFPQGSPDGVVDFRDFTVLAESWLSRALYYYAFKPADLTKDGALNLNDLDILCQQRLTPGPQTRIYARGVGFFKNYCNKTA